MSSMNLELGCSLGPAMGGGASLEDQVIAMFEGGVRGAFIDPSDDSTVFQEISSPSTFSDEDDVIGTINTLAGTFDYFASATDARRPTRKTIDGAQGILWDGNDRVLERNLSMVGSTTFTHFCAVHAQSASTWILSTGTTASSHWYGCCQNGQSADSYLSAGTPASFVDNVSIGAETRDNLHDNAAIGAWVVLEVRDITDTNFAWIRLGGHSNAAFKRDLYSGPEIIIPSSIVDTGSNRQTILDYFTEKVGAP